MGGDFPAPHYLGGMGMGVHYVMVTSFWSGLVLVTLTMKTLKNIVMAK